MALVRENIVSPDGTRIRRNISPFLGQYLKGSFVLGFFRENPTKKSGRHRHGSCWRGTWSWLEEAAPRCHASTALPEHSSTVWVITSIL